MNPYIVASTLKSLMIESTRYIQRDHKFYVIAATLDKRGRIIAIGENSPIKTHPLMKEYAVKAHRAYGQFLHAEVYALVKSQRKVSSIVVIRVNNNGDMALAKPCSICMIAINEAKVRNIWYSTQEGTMEYIKNL